MKQKIFTLFLALAASAGTIFADAVQIGDLYYNLDTENKTAEVTKAINGEYSGDITIPDTVEHNSVKYAVTEIGSAFMYCTDLTSVTIPNSVTLINNGAFYECTSLKEITIPNSVTEIGEGAFRKCSGLTSVNIGNSVTLIGREVFRECTGLTSVTIPNSVTLIGYEAFFFCPNLTSVSIPNSVIEIGKEAFCGCSSLISLEIPNSVTKIGKYAFSFVPNIVYHGTATGSPWEARSVNGFVEGSLVYSDDTKTTLLACPTSAIGEMFIPNSVTEIVEAAFRDCSGLTSVIIPNSVIKIADGAFENCTGLTSITCEAVTPPTCGRDQFAHVDYPLYVPAGSVDAYKAADEWKYFGDNIKPIQAADADVTDLQAAPTENSVVLSWPKKDEAVTYTIVIMKGDEKICTLTFNAEGQLTGIQFAPSRNGGRDSQVRTATQTTTGWKYTIGGLEANTTYSYNVIAKRNVSDTDNLYNKTITFTTKNTPTGIDEVSGQPSEVSTQKIMRNGQMLIERNGEVYNVQGARVK